MMYEVDEYEAARANFEELRFYTDRQMYRIGVYCNQLGVIINELRQEDEGTAFRIQDLERRLTTQREPLTWQTNTDTFKSMTTSIPKRLRS